MKYTKLIASVVLITWFRLVCEIKLTPCLGSPCSGTNNCFSSWSSLTSVCSPTDCPIPDDIPNAHMLYNGLTNGSTAVYACMPGYTSNSYDYVIHCVSGVWSSSDMNCKVVCPLPPAIANAEVTVENNTARYFCTSGYYQLENTDYFTVCDGNIWQPTNFECIKICGAPPTIANAEVMRYNNKAMYSCREGYRSMSGSNRVNCTNSAWQTTTFSCYALSCGPAPNITNADVLVNDDGAMYACHYGSTPSNINNRVLCEAGTWSPTDFQCLNATGSIGSNFDNQTLERWIKQIKQDLLIDKRNTNAYMRTLISVYDPRPASIAIGGSGVVLLCIATFIFVLPDVLTFCKHVFDKISKATKSETGSQ